MQPGAAKQSLLLVDGDPKSLRVLDVSLKKADFQVAAAASGVEALAALEAGAVPDLIICDTNVGEMDGFELCRRIKERPEWAKIPFIFLSSEKSIEEKIRGLELGVEDYLVKPIYIKEITTRARMLLQRQQRERLESRREGRTKFAGQLSDIGVIDLVQTIDVNRKSGIIHILNRENRRGAIYFRDGKIIDAEVGRLSGPDALYRLLSWSEGMFEVEFKAIRRKEVIELSQQALLMEGMRRLDEWTHLLEKMPPLQSVFEVDYHLLAQKLAGIPDEVNGIVRLFDGRRTLLQVVEDCDYPDLETLSIVGKLHADGLIYESHPEPEPQAAPGISTESGEARLERWLATASVAEPVVEKPSAAAPERVSTRAPAPAPFKPIVTAPVPPPAASDSNDDAAFLFEDAEEPPAPMAEPFVNWSRTVTAHPTERHAPDSEDQILEILRIGAYQLLHLSRVPGFRCFSAVGNQLHSSMPCCFCGSDMPFAV